MKKSYKLLVLGVAMLCFGLGNLQAQNNNYASLSYFNKIVSGPIRHKPKLRDLSPPKNSYITQLKNLQIQS